MKISNKLKQKLKARLLICLILITAAIVAYAVINFKTENKIASNVETYSINEEVQKNEIAETVYVDITVAQDGDDTTGDGTKKRHMQVLKKLLKWHKMGMLYT